MNRDSRSFKIVGCSFPTCMWKSSYIFVFITVHVTLFEVPRLSMGQPSWHQSPGRIHLRTTALKVYMFHCYNYRRKIIGSICSLAWPGMISQLNSHLSIIAVLKIISTKINFEPAENDLLRCISWTRFSSSKNKLSSVCNLLQKVAKQWWVK